jgi:hypothetical protein
MSLWAARPQTYLLGLHTVNINLQLHLVRQEGDTVHSGATDLSIIVMDKSIPRVGIHSLTKVQGLDPGFSRVLKVQDLGFLP